MHNKIQKNPIFQISVDILSNTNFFRAFTASASVPAIYMQQFWNTMKYDEKTGVYSCQVDEQWFDLSTDLLRKALAITLSSPQLNRLVPPSGKTSGIHYNTGDDFILVNLKYVPKGETVEVFGMAILDPLITEAIQQSSYYPKYLEMPAPAPTKNLQAISFPHNVRKGKPTFQLVDEDDECSCKKSVPQEEGDDPDLELAKKMSLDAHQEKGEGEGADADMERAIKLSLDTAFLPQGQAPVGGVTIRDPVSETTPKLPEVVASERTLFVRVTSGVSIPVSTQGQAGSDPEKAHEALAGPDPEPMKEDQTGSDSGKVHVSLQYQTRSTWIINSSLSAYPRDLSRNTLCWPCPESTESDSKRVRRRLSGIKKERGEDKPISNILHSGRFPANYHLYHALMEALIADEDAMDKEVKDRVKNHKRKHDSDDDEDDDDDEGPSAGSNQALTSTGWQITDTRDAVVDSSMHISDPESEHSEQSSDDIPMQDEGHVSDLEDTDNAHIPKVSTTTWFKPIPEGERPATPKPEWTIPPNNFSEPENNWANT
ncbi:hypothetical protein Tco_1082523 [Tanacetum coccineum]|uniref:Uncharacterized protein n=1 Tax=Tanacetum coccineum TaxID=301880 RepID=A0ABQ5I0N5_9ASTR